MWWQRPLFHLYLRHNPVFVCCPPGAPMTKRSEQITFRRARE